MDYENLPKRFREAALLLKRWNDIQIELGSPDMSFIASLHTFKHYLGLFCYKNKNDRYSAAEKLCGAYFKAASKRGMAFLADNFSDQASKNIELASFSFTFKSFCSKGEGMKFYLSLDYYELAGLETQVAFSIGSDRGYYP